jgi:hypothetical protein
VECQLGRYKQADKPALLATHILASTMFVTKTEAGTMELPCGEVTRRQRVNGGLLYVGTELNDAAQQIRRDIIDPNMESLHRFFACTTHYFEFLYVSIREHKCYAKLVSSVTSKLNNTASHPKGFEEIKFEGKNTSAYFAVKFVSRLFSFYANSISRDMQYLLQRRSGGKNRYGHLNFRDTKLDMELFTVDQAKKEK